LYTAPKTSH